MAATLPFVSNHMWCTITHCGCTFDSPHINPPHGVPLPIALHIRCPHVNQRLHSHIIHPNETVGAAPMCPPERPRSDVSMQKSYIMCGD